MSVEGVKHERASAAIFTFAVIPIGDAFPCVTDVDACVDVRLRGHDVDEGYRLGDTGPLARFIKTGGRPLAGPAFGFCGRRRVARPAGKAQSGSTWRVRRFEAPQEYKFPVDFVPKLMGMSGAPWSGGVGGPLTKVLQHSALHLQVGAVTRLRVPRPETAATHLSLRQGWRNETTTMLTGARGTRRSWTDFGGAMRVPGTLPLTAPSGAATRSTGLGDQSIGRVGSECSRTPVPRL